LTEYPQNLIKSLQKRPKLSNRKIFDSEQKTSLKRLLLLDTGLLKHEAWDKFSFAHWVIPTQKRAGHITNKNENNPMQNASMLGIYAILSQEINEKIIETVLFGSFNKTQIIIRITG